jgi:hypothetical protein
MAEKENLFLLFFASLLLCDFARNTLSESRLKGCCVKSDFLGCKDFWILPEL